MEKKGKGILLESTPLLEEVLSLLDLRDLGKLSQASRRWKNYLRSFLHMMKQCLVIKGTGKAMRFGDNAMKLHAYLPSQCPVLGASKYLLNLRVLNILRSRFFTRWGYDRTLKTYFDTRQNNQMISRANVNKYIVRALRHFELSERGYDFPATPVEMITDPDTGLIYTLFAVLGPPNSPHEGGLFLIEFHWGTNYPFLNRAYPFQNQSAGLAVKFASPVLHPNISATGEIDLDVLHAHSYSPVLYTQLLLLSIVSFLNDPNPGCSDFKQGFHTSAGLSSLYLQDPVAYQACIHQHTLSQAVMTPQRLREELGKYSGGLAEEVAMAVEGAGGALLDELEGPLRRLAWPIAGRHLL